MRDTVFLAPEPTPPSRQRTSGVFKETGVEEKLDDMQDFAAVGQRQHQGVIAPGAVVADVHALLALAAGLDQKAIYVHDGLPEEVSRLLLPHGQACVVDDNLIVDVGSGHDGFGAATQVGFVESSLDTSLAVGQLLPYALFHLKSLVARSSGE